MEKFMISEITFKSEVQQFFKRYWKWMQKIKTQQGILPINRKSFVERS